MKILHTADWHLGKKLDHYSRFDEQKLILEEIITIANHENVDAVVVAGDLFDTFNPSAEVVELLYSTLKKLTNNATRPVIAIAGNHDSADRIEAPDALAKECGIFFIGYPDTKIASFSNENNIQITKSDNGFVEFLLPNTKESLRILTTPYANEIRLKTFLGIGIESKDNLNYLLQHKWQALADQYCDDKGVNILLAHLYMMHTGMSKPVESEDERPIMIGNADAIFTENIPAQIQYTALGHIHRGQNLDENKQVYYAGSPLQYSFSEAGQDKYVHIVEVVAGGKPYVKKIILQNGKRLVRKKFLQIVDAVNWLKQNPDSLVELTIQSHQYLSANDRKILQKNHDGIIAIIPELIQEEMAQEDAKSIDLSQNMIDLFRQYFQYKKGQEISEDLLSLFKEIQSNEL